MNGPRTRRTPRMFGPGERAVASELAADLYTAGHTVRCTALTLGWSWTTTHRLIREAGVAFRPRGSNSTCITPEHKPGT